MTCPVICNDVAPSDGEVSDEARLQPAVKVTVAQIPYRAMCRTAILLGGL
jgi:hypothetical protein